MVWTCSCCSAKAKLVDSLPVWPGKPPGGACGSPYGTAATTRISVYGVLCSTPPPAGGGTQGQKSMTCGGSYFPLLNVCDPGPLVSPPRCAWFCSGALSDVPPLSLYLHNDVHPTIYLCYTGGSGVYLPKPFFFFWSELCHFFESSDCCTALHVSSVMDLTFPYSQPATDAIVLSR